MTDQEVVKERWPDAKYAEDVAAVRAVFPKAWTYDNGDSPRTWDGYGNLIGNGWHEARQHPSVVEWERKERAQLTEMSSEELTRQMLGLLDNIRDEAVAMNATIAEQAATILDYKEVLADKRRLTRELDVAMHGADQAARQASLCDLIGPARDMRLKIAEQAARIAEMERDRFDLGGLLKAAEARVAELEAQVKA